MIEALILVVFPFCMVFAMVSDMLSMTIANRVSILLAATFAAVAPLAGLGWDAYAMHMAAGLVVLTVTFGLFALGVIGGGDAKLMAATALWLGFSMELVQYLVYAALIGGALTLAIVMFRAMPLSVYAGHNLFLRNFADRQAGVPYAIALGLSGLMVYPATPLAQAVIARLAAL